VSFPFVIFVFSAADAFVVEGSNVPPRCLCASVSCPLCDLRVQRRRRLRGWRIKL